MSKMVLAGAVAALALSIPAATANAATYFSYFEYKNTAPDTAVAPFGKVTLNELNANSVEVLVELYDPQIGFVNTGNGNNKVPFTFSLTGDYDVQVFNDLAGQEFADGGFGSFQNNNFGLYTNKIDCCGGKTGGNKYDPTDLRFIVTNLGGLTFAGVGATFDPIDGRLLSSGTGPQFLSTVASGNHPAGFWFSADVVTNTGATFNIAARDAFRVGVVPEPATWAMMIIGFGAAGSVLRRRRTVAI